MKTLLVLFACAALAQSSLLPHHRQHVHAYHGGNIIDDLIRETLEYIRSLMKKHDPWQVPQFPPLDINDDLVNLHIEAKDVLVSKASDFTIDEITNDLINLKAEFKVTLPSLHVEGSYSATGDADKHKVEGNGKLTVDIANFVQSGQIQFSLANHEVQILDLKLEYDLESVNIDLDGLTVEGMTPEQLKQWLNTKFMDLIMNHKDEVAARVAAQVKEQANKLMEGKSLEDIIEFLKHLIDPTAAPALA